MRPVLVVGTGRSGTSTVARILHENLGVRMFRTEYLRPDQWGPKGYYEDVVGKGMTKKVAAGKVSPEDFAELVERGITDGLDIPWGLKVPQFCYAPVEALDALNPQLIIVCIRERTQVGASITRWRQRNWKLSEKDGLAMHDNRLAAMLKLLHGRQVLWLDFSEPRDEDELELILALHLTAETVTAPS